MIYPLGYKPPAGDDTTDIVQSVEGDANTVVNLSVLNLEPILQFLLNHARVRLEGAGVNVDRAVITPGTPAWDSSCGLLADWVTGINPNYSGSGGSSCLVSYDVGIALGFYECITGLTNQGKPPTESQVTADGVKIINHMSLLMQAISCDLALSDQVGPVVLQSWTPSDPQGNMAGGVWRFTVNVLA